MPGIVLNHRQYRRHVWRRNISDIAVPTLIRFMKHTPNHIKLPKIWNRRWWSVHFNLLRHETFNSSQTEIQRLSYSKLLGYNFDKGADSSNLSNVTHSFVFVVYCFPSGNNNPSFLMCLFAMRLCHSSHQGMESISIPLESMTCLTNRIWWKWPCAVMSLCLQRSWNFCFRSFRILSSCKETQAKQLKIQDYGKRGKTLCGEALLTFSTKVPEMWVRPSWILQPQLNHPSQDQMRQRQAIPTELCLNFWSTESWVIK